MIDFPVTDEELTVWMLEHSGDVINFLESFYVIWHDRNWRDAEYAREHATHIFFLNSKKMLDCNPEWFTWRRNGLHIFIRMQGMPWVAQSYSEFDDIRGMQSLDRSSSENVFYAEVVRLCKVYNRVKRTDRKS